MSYLVRLSGSASAVALMLALSQAGLAAEPTPVAPATAPQAAAPTPPPAEPGKPDPRWEERRADLNQRYADLRKRAEEAGMPLPERPPWERMSSGEMPMAPPMSEEDWNAMHERMMKMTPEEREALREQQYQKMRERAKTRGVDLPETPPWKQQAANAEQMARYKEIIDAMSDEQREACQAMSRRPWGRMPPMGRMAMPPQAAEPDAGWGGWEYPNYGPGYGGYGPYYPRWSQPWGPQY